MSEITIYTHATGMISMFVNNSFHSNFDSVEELPEWMQHNIAALKMVGVFDVVEGVGKRTQMGGYAMEGPLP